MSGWGRIAGIFIPLLILTAGFAGCLDDDDDEPEEQEGPPPDYPYEEVRNFTTIDPLTNETYNATWAIFRRAQGGNCCEHYLATTHNGWITNLGGEYPTWSEDRGENWSDYRPISEPFDGLGEGAIIEAPNGDILSMSWYPYSGDRFIAYFYDSGTGRWYDNMIEREYPLFYDRPWIAVVPGPITTLAGTFPWAGIITSNLWDDMMWSLDGLNYEPMPDPSTAQGTEVFDLDFEPGPELDFLTPHREIQATPIPTGGLLLPRYFGDENAFLRPDLTWARHRTECGTPLPAPHLVIDSSGALHSVGRSGKTLIYHLSLDGGKNWSSQNFTWEEASRIEEWEFQADGVHELAVINMRVQVGDADKDIVFHILDYRESIEADSITLIGLGDVDATSGAGHELRFDFASLAILPDGGVIVSYQDSEDEDPLFALELEMPYGVDEE